MKVCWVFVWAVLPQGNSAGADEGAVWRSQCQQGEDNPWHRAVWEGNSISGCLVVCFRMVRNAMVSNVNLWSSLTWLPSKFFFSQVYPGTYIYTVLIQSSLLKILTLEVLIQSKLLNYCRVFYSAVLSKILTWHVYRNIYPATSYSVQFVEIFTVHVSSYPVNFNIFTSFFLMQSTLLIYFSSYPIMFNAALSQCVLI